MKHKILRRGDGRYTVLIKYRFWPLGWFIVFDRVSTLTLAKKCAKDHERDSRKSVEISKCDSGSEWIDKEDKQ